MGRMVQGGFEMKMSMLAAALLLVSHPSLAEEGVIDLQACRQLVAHKPDADVAYQPGVDVNGNPVVEADLNASPVKVPNKVTFDVTVDMAQYLGITVPVGLEGQVTMGTVAYEDGVLTFNGEPMEGPAVAALREICDGKKPEKPKENHETDKHNQ